MDSKEFGLVAAQQLFQVEDLHYGFWEIGEQPSFQNLQRAQENHTEFLLKHIITQGTAGKILDIGCGIGNTTQKLLSQGHRVDGLVPSEWMARIARKKVSPFANHDRGKVFFCPLEDLPVTRLQEKYTLVFFSESYQYVNMQKAFSVIDKILIDQGKVVIFDFFKKDNAKGKSPLKGGHSLRQFYEIVTDNGYIMTENIDVTKNLSPNLTLVNEMLVQRLIPFSNSLDNFLSHKHKLTYRLIKWLLRKKIDKAKFKYSEQRNAENFQKYKSYRLIVLTRKK
ncbi:class I SAM-dependent methyltransferase [Microbulbifer sp. 2304DJ12-6]|uniref:class I SAM-dependent methyltransferase n=1 Tax=Microbulbifer sp. 2304DJ12-6 TaxID=3233340 RepID=UPI00261A821F|nr:class I SAM-dependent methyltransferase [uncultured Microbulbifer sp.]